MLRTGAGGFCVAGFDLLTLFLGFLSCSIGFKKYSLIDKTTILTATTDKKQSPNRANVTAKSKANGAFNKYVIFHLLSGLYHLGIIRKVKLFVEK